ncbi:hypothetical protein niasHT_030169 [Heterodera trifolii]|uniref:Uncharacterized protein n=1 Tax=Heterodera trifolii TaxID=157864 RepID=A0ABD2K309_9BILA
MSNSLIQKEIERYKAMYEREREQFEEFQRYSKELESEMELELKQRDQKISELESVKHRLSIALEQLKVKSEKDRHEQRTTEEQLRTRLLNSDEQCTELRHKLRAVEQQNDNLERRERIHTQQLIDLSERYDHCLERCAMLEAGMAVPPSPQALSLAVNGGGVNGVVTHCQQIDSADHQPMDFASSSVNNIADNPSSTTDTSPEGPAMRERVRQTLNGRPTQRLIEQMLRKVEAAEAHLNISSFSSSTVSSFYDSPPATAAVANGLQRNSNNGANNSF